MTSPGNGQRSQAADLIATWADDNDQGLVSRKLVIDRLLDLRNLASDRDLVAIDAILADVPGLTVVEARWWHRTVQHLEHVTATCLGTEGARDLVGQRREPHEAE